MYPNVALFQDLYPISVILYTEMESMEIFFVIVLIRIVSNIILDSDKNLAMRLRNLHCVIQYEGEVGTYLTLFPNCTQSVKKQKTVVTYVLQVETLLLLSVQVRRFSAVLERASMVCLDANVPEATVQLVCDVCWKAGVPGRMEPQLATICV